MGEIVERIAQSLADARRNRDESAAAVNRLIEAGDFSGTQSSEVADLWEAAQRADEDYDLRFWYVKRSFPEHADTIIARSEEL